MSTLAHVVRRGAPIVLSLTVLCTLATSAGRANTIQWNTITPASFGNPASWLTGVVPGPTDIALFGWDPKFRAAQPISVSFSSSVSNNQLVIQDAVHNFDVGGNTYTLNSIGRNGPDASVLIGDNLLTTGSPGSATLNLTNGTVAAQGTILGMVAGNSGTLNVGAGAVWNGRDFLDVGLNGTGSLNITGGGIVNNLDSAIAGDTTTTLNTTPGSIGNVVVSGTGSQWDNNGGILSIGDRGTGSLTIQKGGLVTAAGDSLVGTNPGAIGSILVTDPTSKWTTSGFLEVGSSGQGSLTVQNGAVVNGFKGFVATLDGNGQASVTGPGSQWNLSNDLQVGRQGQGSLSISQGGVVTNLGGYVGVLTADPGFSTKGSVLVDGIGSQWKNAGPLTVGGGYELNATGTGSLVVQNGGFVSSTLISAIGLTPGSIGDVQVTGTGSLWDNSTGVLGVGVGGQGSLEVTAGGKLLSFASAIGVLSGSSGSARVSGTGSLWANSDTLDVGPAGTGILTVEKGGIVTASTLTVGTAGTLQGDGGLVLANVVDDGVIQPGGSAPGTLVIQGDLQLHPDGSILLDIGGADPSLYSHLLVSGKGTFTGLIDVEFINGFLPIPGELFNLIGVGGSFDFTGAMFRIGGLPSAFAFENIFAGGYSLLTSGETTTAPEPGSVVFGVTGIFGLLVARRVRRR
ncbi:MAG: hypothetical protein JWO80_2106 [Bryobacterales bacterium]|nr:hypothetical protein [Bryobacterales bacterium]